MSIAVSINSKNLLASQIHDWTSKRLTVAFGKNLSGDDFELDSSLD